MVFSSNVFLFLFFPAVLIFYFISIVKSRSLKNLILLMFSIGFYLYGEPAFVFVVIIDTLINWYAAIIIEKSTKIKKLITAIVIVLDILILGIFKYLTFITGNIASITKNNNYIIKITLPIGISFFMFQMMSYVFDVYYGTAKAQKNPLNVLLYIFLFPQMIAGPIVRYKTIESEITERVESQDDFTKGVMRFVYGLGKKMLIANNIAPIADFAFSNIGYMSVATAWIGAIAYTLQIYFDFSGYSDMAIGLGLIFGFHFPENFNYPYIAKSVTDFWRRWHISLSIWFRDYVYIPLGGNRVSKGKWIRNLFIVWLLTGIWHGANWTFIVWGLIYFCFLLAEKLVGVEKLETHIVLSRIYTMFVVVVAWVVFRAESIGEAIQYIKAMFGIGGNSLVDEYARTILHSNKVILLISIIFAVPIGQLMNKPALEKVKQMVEPVFLIEIFIVSAAECISSAYNPFIYFNF